MKRSAGLVMLLLLAAPLMADEATLDAWKNLQAAQTESQTLRDAVSGLFQKMETEEGKAAAREVFMTALKRGGTLVWKAENEFREAFDNSKWKQWEATEHSDLYRTGLDLSARHALEHEPKKALETYELLIARFPESGEAAYAKSTWLPIALPAAGDYDHALKRLQELHADAGDVDKPGLQMAIGDVYCVAGDIEAALKEYKAAIAAIDAAGELEKYDRRAAARRYLELRAALVGRVAPEIDSEVWFGAPAKKLSELRGNVVVIDFWATWCGPCIGSIPGIDNMYRARRDQDLVVLGVTRRYDKRGLLPDSRDELLKQYRSGESYTGEGHVEYVKHLEAFRERCDVTYPFVLAEAEDMRNYKVTGIPTVFVVDKEGVIRFVAIGGAKEALITAVVDGLLNDKPAEDESSNTQRAIDAYAAQNDALQEAIKLVTSANAAEKAAETEEEKAAAKEAKAEAGRKANALINDSRAAFSHAFAAADWDQLLAPEHRELLETGLYQTGMEALHADPALAVRAFEFYRANLPKGGSDRRVSALGLRRGA